MLTVLVTLFVIVPIADLALLLFLSTKIGWQTSIGLVVASGILGAWLLRRSYQGIWRKLQDPSIQLSQPFELLSDGAMIFLGAGLLLTPGFITDLIGISLLFPICRQWYRKFLSNWLKRSVKFQFTRYSTYSANTTQGDSDEIVEGSVLRPNGSKPPPRITP